MVVVKQCPKCRTTAQLQAGFCQQCGHLYSTQFDAHGQRIQPVQQAQPQYPPQQFQQPTGQPVYPAQPVYQQQPMYQAVNVYVPVAPQSTGLAITAMVLGIISLVAWCIPIFAILLAVLAIIFGCCGLKQHKGMAWTGIICGGIHFVFWVGLFLLVTLGVLGAGAAASGVH